MKILIVGTVLKDVYLNLDERKEQFEKDAGGIRWLDIAFDASEHYFFSRNSSLGGAAISLEVLEKMGLEAEISGVEMKLGEERLEFTGTADDYRYILVAEEQMSYFSASNRTKTRFVPPKEPVDVIYIDRSAELDRTELNKIENYKVRHPKTRLVIYVEKTRDLASWSLIERADMLFLESRDKNLPPDKTVLLSEKMLLYNGLSEQIRAQRIDLATHLSTYLIAAATILGGRLIGRGAKESLRLAKANIEHSTLDTTLELEDLDRIVAEEQAF